MMKDVNINIRARTDGLMLLRPRRRKTSRGSRRKSPCCKDRARRAREKVPACRGRTRHARNGPGLKTRDSTARVRQNALRARQLFVTVDADPIRSTCLAGQHIHFQLRQFLPVLRWGLGRHNDNGGKTTGAGVGCV